TESPFGSATRTHSISASKAESALPSQAGEVALSLNDSVDLEMRRATCPVRTAGSRPSGAAAFLPPRTAQLAVRPFPTESFRLSRNVVVEDGERSRLDRSRRRPADEPAALPWRANGEWNRPHQLFGETPNRATGTGALPFSI